MNAEDARHLFEYNAWADRRMLAACEPLPEAVFARAVVSSFPSLAATVEHIRWVEWLWLERWRGRSPGPPAANPPASVAQMRARWQPLEADLLAFVRGLADPDLTGEIEYRNTQGTPYRTPLWQMLQHVANHGTYHRGQVTTLLRQAGGTPAATDYTVYWRERAGEPPR